MCDCPAACPLSKVVAAVPQSRRPTAADFAGLLCGLVWVSGAAENKEGHWRIHVFFMFVLQIETMNFLTASKKVSLWSPGAPCLPVIRFFCGSTLMLVRVQLVICAFALHGPVHSSRSRSTTQSTTTSSATQFFFGKGLASAIPGILVQHAI